MTYAKGDKVAVLDAAIRGEVLSVKGNRVLISDEHGFELDFDKSQLVKISREQSEMSRYSDINNHFFAQKKQEKPVKKSPLKTKKRRTEVHPPMEVDLHIQHLVKSTRGMSNFDMLDLQLNTAKFKLEFAIRKRIPRVVFIHGVGEGVLQKELSYLFAKYPVKTSQASYQKYGLGATEVYILQNKSIE